MFFVVFEKKTYFCTGLINPLKITTVMTELFKAIEEKLGAFAGNAKDFVEKGNKAAGARARKASLELEKLMKEFRKQSVAK